VTAARKPGNVPDVTDNGPGDDRADAEDLGEARLTAIFPGSLWRLLRGWPRLDSTNTLGYIRGIPAVGSQVRISGVGWARTGRMQMRRALIRKSV
jgi:hypothetical protein